MSNIQDTNSETMCNKNKIICDHLKITESVVQSNPDINIKKLICNQLGMYRNKYLLNICYQDYKSYTFYIVYNIKLSKIQS